MWWFVGWGPISIITKGFGRAEFTCLFAFSHTKNGFGKMRCCPNLPEFTRIHPNFPLVWCWISLVVLLCMCQNEMVFRGCVVYNKHNWSSWGLDLCPQLRPRRCWCKEANERDQVTRLLGGICARMCETTNASALQERGPNKKGQQAFFSKATSGNHISDATVAVASLILVPWCWFGR